MEIYQAIKQFREELEIGQEELCELLKIKQPQYSRYETGKRPFPSQAIKKICIQYNISADYLLGLPEGLVYPDRHNPIITEEKQEG